jgi:hypothetical protein
MKTARRKFARAAKKLTVSSTEKIAPMRGQRISRFASRGGGLTQVSSTTGSNLSACPFNPGSSGSGFGWGGWLMSPDCAGSLRFDNARVGFEAGAGGAEN